MARPRRRAPRADGVVLARPPDLVARQGRAGTDAAPAPSAAGACAGQLPRAPASDHHRRRHAALARRQLEPRVGPERELRPRGDGAVLPRPRELHRGRRPQRRLRVLRVVRRRRTGQRGHSEPEWRTHGTGRVPRHARSSAPKPRSTRSAITRRARRSSPGRSTSTSSGARPDSDVLAELAGSFRDSGLDIAALVAATLRHPAFLDARNNRPRTPSSSSSPPGTSSRRRLELWVLNDLGQVPFEPPNVAGWPGSARWVSAGAVFAKAQLACDNSWDTVAVDTADPVGRDPRQGRVVRGQRRDPRCPRRRSCLGGVPP